MLVRICIHIQMVVLKIRVLKKIQPGVLKIGELKTSPAVFMLGNLPNVNTMD